MAHTVMIIDSNPDVLAMMESVLSEAGYNTDVFVYTPDGLSAIEASAPDVLIVDQMYESAIPGWELIQQVRLDPQTQHLPIILCTTEAKKVEELSEHLMQHNIAVVLKPFDIDDLLTAVTQAVARPPKHSAPATNAPFA